ncbi:MAG: hypothetical protein L0Y56_03045 [Nitrospira sp.]|nr:hypothetical protein [Nitrospira sp.]
MTMQHRIIGTAIVVIVTIVLLFVPERTAQASNTTVVISVSIGGGVAVGMVGWFIHLTYSQRVAQADQKPHTLSAQAETPREVLGQDSLWSEWNRDKMVFPPTPWLGGSEDTPPKQTAFIRFVEFPW